MRAMETLTHHCWKWKQPRSFLKKNLAQPCEVEQIYTPQVSNSPVGHRGHGSTWNVQGQMNAERSRLGRRRRVTAAQKRESMPSTGTSLNPERIPLREVSQNQKEHCQKQSCVSKSAHRPLVQERTNRLSNGRTSF